MNKIYAGIGSRETPPLMCRAIEIFSRVLSEEGFKLRSGNAMGADQAFHRGASTHPCEIYLPWSSYNSLGLQPANTQVFRSPTIEASRIAALHHPSWYSLNRPAQTLHARNSHIVLGLDCKSPVDFVVCWTKGGKGQGGTGQAMRIAVAREIPVFDLAVYNVRTIYEKIQELK